MTHDVTKQFSALVTERAQQMGVDNDPRFRTLLSEKEEELDAWLDKKPNFVKSLSVLGDTTDGQD